MSKTSTRLDSTKHLQRYGGALILLKQMISYMEFAI